MHTLLQSHPERNVLRLQLRQNVLLSRLDDAAFAELDRLLVMEDGLRGDVLLRQGDSELRQYFVVSGLVKRMVTSSEGRELTLRFADERDMETCFDAWKLESCAMHSVVCVTKARVAWLPMNAWGEFLDRHAAAKQAFDDCLVRLTTAIMGHAITLHLLDAPSRVNDFSYKFPELIARIPQKELASHLNLSAETLCRLVRRPRTASQRSRAA